MLALAAWNALVFLLYGYDKLMAVMHRWRIPEKVLLTSSVILGGIGAALGMLVFHHKIRKPRFYAAFVIGILLTALLFGNSLTEYVLSYAKHYRP